MSEKLNIETLRQAVKSLTENVMPMCPITPSTPYLTVDGVVVIGSHFMHPQAFRDVFGEEEYQELLDRPRVSSPYSESE